MKKFIFAFCVALIGCSDVEFSQTDEALRKKLNENGIQINYGAKYTQHKAVHLSILGEEEQLMYITNDPSCETGGDWEEYSEEKNWELSQLNQSAKVYVKFKGERDLESSCLNDDIIHDDIPPELSFTNQPRYLNNQKELKIGLVAKDNASGVGESYCALEGNDGFVKCKDKLDLIDITEGEHNLLFSAVDKAGNRAEPIHLKWYTDLTRPRAKFHRVPPKLSNLSDFTVSYEGQDESGIAGYNCSLNRQPYTNCSSESFFYRLKNGKQLFAVIAVDKAGNLSEPIKYDWVVDKEVPTVKITKHPNTYTRSINGEFQFIGMDKGQSLDKFQCQVNSQAWVNCKSPFTTASLQKGSQIFRVRTIDLAGNISAPASYAWVVDLTPPQIQLLSKPNKLTNKAQAQFNLRATDTESGVKRYWCWLNGIEKACTRSNVWSNLGEGVHHFEALAEDKVGNYSERVKYSWTIDLQAPILKFTKVPHNFIAENFADIAFEATDDSGVTPSYYCKLLGTAFESCASPHALKDLREGKHSFFVKAKDAAGNFSETITHTWHVDKTPPVIKFVKKPKDHMNFQSSIFRIRVSDRLSGLNKVWCGLKGQLKECKADQELEYRMLNPGQYEFEVTAMDNVGNKSTQIHQWEVFDKYREVDQKVQIDEYSMDVDILFVVDNSDSMAEEQRNMATRINNFISKLTDLNWQIAVTSTDPRKRGAEDGCFGGIDPFCEEVDLEHGDGGLVKFGNSQHVLDPSIDDIEAQRLLGNAIQLGAGGSSSEEGIRATYRALEKSFDPSFPQHQHFIRSDAALAVILISDEDESDNDRRNKPENLLNFVKQNFPNKSFKYHSMINLPEFNCVNNDLGFGDEYKKMSRLTGGIIGSVCQDNYSEDLSIIGEDVKNQVSSVELQCIPQDRDNDGKADLIIELEVVDLAPSYKIEGKKVTFSKPLPPGKHKLKYVCLK